MISLPNKQLIGEVKTLNQINHLGKKASCAVISFILFVFMVTGCSSSGGAASEENMDSKPVHMYSAAYIETSFPEMVREASTILYGEITNIQPSRQRDISEYSKQVYTPIEITPIELVKGGEGKEPVLYNRLGGEYEGIIYKLEGNDLTFKKGQRIFIFLSDINSDLGPTSVYIENNGKFSVWDDDQKALKETTPEEYIAKVKAELATPTVESSEQ